MHNITNMILYTGSENLTSYWFKMLRNIYFVDSIGYNKNHVTYL